MHVIGCSNMRGTVRVAVWLGWATEGRTQQMDGRRLLAPCRRLCQSSPTPPHWRARSRGAPSLSGRLLSWNCFFFFIKFNKQASGWWGVDDLIKGLWSLKGLKRGKAFGEYVLSDWSVFTLVVFLILIAAVYQECLSLKLYPTHLHYKLCWFVLFFLLSLTCAPLISICLFFCLFFFNHVMSIAHSNSLRVKYFICVFNQKPEQISLSDVSSFWSQVFLMQITEWLQTGGTGQERLRQPLPSKNIVL